MPAALARLTLGVSSRLVTSWPRENDAPSSAAGCNRLWVLYATLYLYDAWPYYRDTFAR